MSNRFFAGAVVASLLGLVGPSLGCNKSPSAPSPPGSVPQGGLSVAAISPAGGLSGDVVQVVGSGFQPQAILTLGGVAARVTGVTSTVILAVSPTHEAGAVDVVVTNPDRQSATLTRGYTYAVVTLTVSRNAVTPGAPLSVTFVAPGKRSTDDWVGLFKVGDPSTNYTNGWWAYTEGVPTATFTLSAPTQPGEYEFRYLLDDGFLEFSRSTPVTVLSPL